MANTYKQAYFHLVFAVKHRKALIGKEWRESLEKYITGIVQNNKHKLIAIGTQPDHIHIFIGYNLNQTIPKLVEEIKTSSNKWINEEKLCNFYFEWQNGYGAFTHSHKQLSVVANYLLNQDERHKQRSFKEEYLDLLTENEISYSDTYLFDFIEH